MRSALMLVAAGLIVTSIATPPAAMQELQIATATSLLEGPTQDADGNVYFSDVLMQRIMRFSRDGVFSVFREKSNVANGLVIDSRNRLIAAEGATSGTAERYGIKTGGIPRVTRTDLTTGAMEILAERYEGTPLSGPNDVTFDNAGRVYFTDMTGGAVYRVDAPGRLVRILAAPDVQRPNGLQISPDDRTLYIVEANGAQGGARHISAFDLLPDGSARNRRVLYDFYPGRSADGMSVDTQGNLYAAAGMHMSRGTAETLDTKCGVYVISPAGKLLKFIPVPEDSITNTAFGGPDMKTLYITAGKTLYKLQNDIAGLQR
jgi:gluconolactonase